MAKNLLVLLPSLSYRVDTTYTMFKYNLEKSGYSFDIEITNEPCGPILAINNLYNKINEDYDYVFTASDKMTVSGPWYDSMKLLDTWNKQYKICGFKEMQGSFRPDFEYGSCYMISTQTIKEKMKGYVFNPIYHCQYADCDLGLQLYFSGEHIEYFKKGEVRMVNVPEKELSQAKAKYFRLDGMCFNYLWANKVGEVPLFDKSLYTDKHLLELRNQMLLKNIWD